MDRPRRAVWIGLALVVALAASFWLGRATSTESGESIPGVVQGLNSSKTSVAFTPDGGSGTGYNLVPDAEGMDLLNPGEHVVLRLANLPDGSAVVYRIDPAP